MNEKVIFSGSGGQGLMTIGKIFANLMLDKAANITFFPSYGAEVRGGTSNCQVILSDEEIASPAVETATSLVLMNQPSVDRFLPQLAQGGLAFVNTSMADAPDRADVIGVPATDVAHEIGNVRVANVVLFGAYLARRDFVTQEEAKTFIARVVQSKGEAIATMNQTALERGWALATA